MNWLIVIGLLVSHLLFLRPFALAVHRGLLPRLIDFVGIGAVIYLDLGLIAEALGFEYTNQFFEPFFSARPDDIWAAAILIALAPWIMRVGSWITNRSTAHQPQAVTSGLDSRRAPLFYLVATAVALYAARQGLQLALSADAIWEARRNVSSELGLGILLLYAPMGLLAFYVRQSDSRTKWGRVFTLFLTAASIGAALAIGQRTLVLLPLLILVIFWMRLSLPKLLLAGTLGIVLAANLATVFKWATATSTQERNLLVETIYGDFHRANQLVETIHNAPTVGTNLMPYAGSGYVYSSLFYVPRSLAPFKGDSTAKYYTAEKAGTAPEDTSWGLGLSLMDELVLNFGFLALVPGLLLYGMVIGWLDRLTWRVPALMPPLAMGAIWIWGYHLPAELLTDGVVAFVALGGHLLFTQTRPVRFAWGERQLI